ncbi:MAG: phospholipase D-like domain-containing protein, partial [Candidatus Hodarchaeota archaeon]
KSTQQRLVNKEPRSTTIRNETTIVHAGNWAKTSFPEDGMKANREWSIAMTDVDVTTYYRDVFDYDWSDGIDYDAGTHGTGSELSYSQTSSTYPRPFAEAGEFSGPMNVTPIFSPDTSLQGILHCINSAQITLDIQIPYFTNYGDDGEVDQVVDAIIAAKDRGVTVRVITEEEAKPDVELVAHELMEHDIPVVYQDERWFSAQHNKGIIVDGKMVLISSINYSDGSIGENREAGVIIENQDVAQWYQEVFDFDWSIGDAGNSNGVNVYWDPNIPSSSSAIKVSVYSHMFDSVDDVKLGIAFGSGSWTNETILSNVEESPEGDMEVYFYNIPAQPDGTDIFIKAYIQSDGLWNSSLEMKIQVRDSIGSATTPTPTPSGNPLAELIVQFGIVIIGAIAAIVAAVIYKKRK